MGVEDILNLRVSEEIIFRAIAPPRLKSEIGDNLYAKFVMERAHIFDAQTEELLELESIKK
jgi:hypothetical protein